MELINVETIRTLAHVALMASAEGMGPAADRVLLALETLRPNEPTIRLCRAMSLARQERFSECIPQMRALAKEHPDNPVIKSILGFMMFSAHQSGWQALLHEVIDDASDPACVELARMVFAEARSDKPAAEPSVHAPARNAAFIRYA